LIMIVAALATRRPSLMAQPEWSATGNICLVNYNSSTSMLRFLLDTLAQIPALYSEQDVILSSQSHPSAITSEDDSYSSHIRVLLHQSLNLLDNARSKFLRWKSSCLDSTFDSLPYTSEPSSKPYPSTLATQFSPLDTANVFNLYNSIVVLLNQLVVSLHKLLPQTELNLLVCNMASDQISLAVLGILNSVDYYLTHSDLTTTRRLGASGPDNLYLLLAIRIGHRVLAHSTLPKDVFHRIRLEDISSIIENKAGAWASNKDLFHIKKV
jgi:hypothetical protein